MTARKFVPRPDAVKIGHMVFGIEWFTEDQWANEDLNRDFSGVTIHVQARIVIRLLGGPTAEAHYQETLTHEILHAIWSTSLLNQSHKHFPEDDREEEIIAITSPWLLGVLKDNPDVMKYLVSER